MKIDLLVFGGGSWDVPQVFLLTIRQRLNSEPQKSFHSSSPLARSLKR
jgi:hypothetical protein